MNFGLGTVRSQGQSGERVKLKLIKYVTSAGGIPWDDLAFI